MNFPIPRLVFGFKYLPEEGKVAECRVCVVQDGRLNRDTKLYTYPFSNVGVNGSICMGNNALPVYKDPARLSAYPDTSCAFPTTTIIIPAGTTA